MFIYEFLYRGPRAIEDTGDKNGAPYYVILAEQMIDPFGVQKLSVSNTLNAAQAEAAGFPLKTIIAEINQEMLTTYNTLLMEKAELIVVNTALANENAELKTKAIKKTP